MTILFTDRRASSTDDAEDHREDPYPSFHQLVQERVARLEGPLFTTDADPEALWRAYITNIPVEHRQHYNCTACRHFIQRYGGLVKVDPDGAREPAVFQDVSDAGFFHDAISAVYNVTARAKITGVYAHSIGPDGLNWGVLENVSKKTGVTWRHLSGRPAKLEVKREPVAWAAEKREEFGMLQRSLGEFPEAVAKEALRVLKADAVDRSEKAVKIAEWFVEAQAERNHPALLWRRIALAPVGFAHLRAGMLGTLLADIQAGFSFEILRRRWNEKMHPLQYMRPTAAPSDGQIAQAEKLFAEMECARSLKRRFARLDELPLLWRPAPPTAPRPAEAAGIFSHLRRPARDVRPLALPAETITWEKFKRTVLDAADGPPAKIEWYVHHGTEGYVSLVTAEDPQAPCLFQWDNHFSWYFYQGGRYPSQYNLVAGAWVAVSGIVYKPTMWGEPLPHFGADVFFLLEGAKDVHHLTGGMVFPECLKSAFHPVRKTMEAYAERATIAGKAEASAAGVACSKAKGAHDTLRFRVDGREFKIDRWD